MRMIAVVATLLFGALAWADPPTLEDYAKAGQPGPEHKKLEPLVGDYTFTMKMWMEPGKPPMEAKGTCTRKIVLGGRFIQETVESDFLGSKFTGIGYMGYDNNTKKYTSTWLDSMSTGVTNSTGTLDGNTITYNGECYDPILKNKSKTKDIIKIEQDKQIVESYKEVDGKETKILELTFTRNK